MNVPPLSNSDLTKSGMLSYYNDMDPNLRKGLIRYTSSDYSTLNTLLRDRLDPNDTNHRLSYPNEIDWINQLDAIIASSPKIDHPFHVYRGVVFPKIITDQIKISGYLNNLGYTSGSLSLDTARGFAGGSCCIFKIVVTDPTNISYVYIKTRTKGEQEILFQRGTHFKLVTKPYKYKYYPKGSNKYELISMYVVTIHPGILVPTSTVTTRAIEEVHPDTKILTSFTRYVEEMEPTDIGMYYNTDNYVNEITDEYIRTHPHYQIDNKLRTIMIRLVDKLV